MKDASRFSLLLLPALLAVLGWSSPAQERSQQPVDDPRARIRSRVELVVVPVTVKGGSGDLVHGIRQEEFRVLEDGKEQDISLFSVDPFPLSAVILIDNGLDLKTAETVQRSAGAIAAGFGPADEVLLARFDAFVAPLTGFVTDNDKLYAELTRLELNKQFPGHGSGPMTAGPRINGAPVGPGVQDNVSNSRQEKVSKNIDDALYEAGKLLQDRGRERRKIIFIISDGRNSRNNTNDYERTAKLLLSADISVYAVGVGNVRFDRGINVLARYAHATGGDVFYVTKRESLEGFYPRVTEQARNQYTLAYSPKDSDSSREWHEIEVRIRRPDLNIITRTGYFRIATQ